MQLIKTKNGTSVRLHKRERATLVEAGEILAMMAGGIGDVETAKTAYDTSELIGQVLLALEQGESVPA